MREDIDDFHFVTAWRDLEHDVHEGARAKGWYENPAAKNDGEMIALMHSELSEALEALRHGNPPSDKIPEFSAVEEELADVVIRIMDYAKFRKLRIAEAMVAKHQMNQTRPHRHGGKRF